MKSFPEYIHDPDMIERTLPVVRPYQIESIEALTLHQNSEGVNLLDTAVGIEIEAIAENQPNLNRVLQALQAHYRLPNEGSPPIHAKKFIAEGFAIGSLTTAKGYRYAPTIAAGTSRKIKEKSRFRSYYHDIQPAALAAFENLDNLELELLLHIVDTNTEGATELLRDALDWQLPLADGLPQQVSARRIGAVTCYTLMSHERMRYRQQVAYETKNKEKAAAKARRIAQIEAEILAMPVLPQLEIGQSVELAPKAEEPKPPAEEPLVSRPKRFIRFNRKMLELLPMNIRREIAAYQAEREYWPEPKTKSGQTQNS